MLTETIKNRYYLSYISNDRDVIGVLVVNHRLKKLMSKYPLACLCTKDVSIKSRDFLKKFGIKIIDINFYENLEKFDIDKNKLDCLYKKHTFGKLFLFLIENIKCVYLDSDFYINKNIDHLFDYDTSDKGIYMTNDLLERPMNSNNNREILNICNQFNSGLIIFESNTIMFNQIAKYISSTPYETIKSWHSDQTILNYLFFKKNLKVTTLSHKYNLIFNSLDFFIKNKLIEEGDIHIVHYTLPAKPWLIDGINRTGVGLCKKYWLKWFDAYYELQENNFNSSNINYVKISNLFIEE